MKSTWIVLLLVFPAIALLACQASPTSRETKQEPVARTEASDPFAKENISHTTVPTLFVDVFPTDIASKPLQSDPTPEVSEMPSNPVPVDKFVSLSKKDLAGRLNINEKAIVLIKTAEMVWPNTALGCPAPGKVYAAGRVPGFQIWLETGGVKYIYNTDQSGRIILCMVENPDGSVVPFSTTGPEISVPIK